MESRRRGRGGQNDCGPLEGVCHYRTHPPAARSAGIHRYSTTPQALNLAILLDSGSLLLGGFFLMAASELLHRAARQRAEWVNPPTPVFPDGTADRVVAAGDAGLVSLSTVGTTSRHSFSFATCESFLQSG